MYDKHDSQNPHASLEGLNVFFPKTAAHCLGFNKQHCSNTEERCFYRGLFLIHIWCCFSIWVSGPDVKSDWLISGDIKHKGGLSVFVRSVHWGVLMFQSLKRSNGQLDGSSCRSFTSRVSNSRLGGQIRPVPIFKVALTILDTKLHQLVPSVICRNSHKMRFLQSYFSARTSSTGRLFLL